jgi:hypothetical protein
MHPTPPEDHLDDLLDRSRPRTTVMTEAVVDGLERLWTAAETESLGARRTRRRWTRPVVAGLLALVMAGGAATAAATSTGLWTPWAETPDAAHIYTLPSGAECEARIGNVQGTDSEVVLAVETFYATTDIDALLTDERIDATIAQLRTEESLVMNADGSSEPGGFGTEHYSADHEYDAAVSRILSEAVTAELDRRGMAGVDANLSWEGETHCPGADW